MTQQRLSEGQVKTNSVRSPLATSFLLSETLDLSVKQPWGLHHSPCEPQLHLGIPNPARPRRKNCPTCQTPVGNSSSPNYCGKEADWSLRSWQPWESPQPSRHAVPMSCRTTGRFYPSSPSLRGASVGETGADECEGGANAIGWVEHQT